MRLIATLLIAGAATAAAVPAGAQEVETVPPLEVGAMAPDFAITAATRHGILRDDVRLSDYRGKIVVLAFFFRARTRG